MQIKTTNPVAQLTDKEISEMIVEGLAKRGYKAVGPVKFRVSFGYDGYDGSLSGADIEVVAVPQTGSGWRD